MKIIFSIILALTFAANAFAHELDCWPQEQTVVGGDIVLHGLVTMEIDPAKTSTPAEALEIVSEFVNFGFTINQMNYLYSNMNVLGQNDDFAKDHNGKYNPEILKERLIELDAFVARYPQVKLKCVARPFMPPRPGSRVGN